MTSEAQARKDTPVYSGFLKYFPDAIAAVARLSKAGNDQHNPDSALHWDRSKSGDEYDACARHLVDRTTHEFDTDDQRHMAKVAWRALAALQKEIEQARALVDLDNRHPQGRGVAEYWCKYCAQTAPNPACAACAATKNENSKPQKIAPAKLPLDKLRELRVIDEENKEALTRYWTEVAAEEAAHE